MTDRSRLRTHLHAALLAARRSGDKPVAASLRTTIAALENAEAVAGGDEAVTALGDHVAGGVVGVGAAEVARLVLSDTQEHDLVRAEIDELRGTASWHRDRGDEERGSQDQRCADLLHEILLAARA